MGFAGESGIEVVVEPDGRYRMSRFLNERLSSPHAEGVLAAGQLAELARTVAVALKRPLPATLGEPVPVNARRLQLRYGTMHCTFVLKPGQEPSPAAAGRDFAAASRFLDVWSTIRRLVPFETDGHN